MANTPVTGNGPFEFTSSAGKQVSIPLTAFGFDSNNNLVVDPAWSSFTSTAPGSVLLAAAVKLGEIAPAALASPFPAMIFRATDPGPGGNNISVTIGVTKVVTSPPTDDPTLVPFDVTIAETDFYPSLTAASIESVLGSRTLAGASVVTGSAPGLVRVLAGSVDTAGEPLSVSGNLTGTPAVLDVDGNGSPALVFTLIAKNESATSVPTHVSITPSFTSPPQPGGATFSLRANWTKTISGVTLPDLAATIAADFGYLVTVSKPGSGAFSLPASGVSQLSGGGAGKAASATIFTSQ
jgi:hypothetical protein